MHGLSVKSRTQGVWDWEVAASLYDYQARHLRAPCRRRCPTRHGRRGHASSTARHRLEHAGVQGHLAAAAAKCRARGITSWTFGLQRDSYTLRTVDFPPATGSTVPRVRPQPGLQWRHRCWACGRRTAGSLRPKLEGCAGRPVRALERPPAALRPDVGNATTTVSHASRNETFVSPKAAVAYQGRPRVLKASTGPRRAHAHGVGAVPGRHQRQRHAHQQRPEPASPKNPGPPS
jgi:iron complex outermembrane receptor protein